VPPRTCQGSRSYGDQKPIPMVIKAIEPGCRFQPVRSAGYRRATGYRFTVRHNYLPRCLILLRKNMT
ncbi:MAG: hypothetical protein WBN37_06010, partial [Arenicellales bacterium]